MASSELLPIDHKRLYRQIAEQLRSLIASGRYAVGELLPPERELALQLGVSRTTVREALIALEVEGRVAVKVGNGVRVLPLRADRTSAAAPRRSGGKRSASAAAAVSPADLWPEVGPIDVLDARLLIEPESAALAAINASNAHRAELRTLSEQLAHESHTDWERPADRRFHECIARASGNPALERLVHALWNQRASALNLRFEQMFTDKRMLEHSRGEHERIVLAIEQRDAELARLWMRRHLSRVRDTYMQAI